MLLAIDVRERWAVADMVAMGLGGDEPLPRLIERPKSAAGPGFGPDRLGLGPGPDTDWAIGT
jgi:hypothetical protein